MSTTEKIEYILKVTLWTQNQLADKIGVKQTTISAWKRGRVVSERYIDRIEQCYNHARRLAWNREQLKRLKQQSKTTRLPKKSESKILSRRGKIVLKFPWYSYQRK